MPSYKPQSRFPTQYIGMQQYPSLWLQGTEQIKEPFLSLSGTVYGYQDHNLCFCRDPQHKNMCVPVQHCGDCDLNRSGECPPTAEMTVPGVS
jgi:hypothetical protein